MSSNNKLNSTNTQDNHNLTKYSELITYIYINKMNRYLVLIIFMKHKYYILSILNIHW